MNIPKPIVTLATQSVSKQAANFNELITLKFFGKSLAKLRAETEIEHDKKITEWEEFEKPLWLEGEALKMGRQYSNLGNTLLKTAPLITADTREVADDNDVFWGLLEHSKEISNEEMQELIAKIIAGEYNVPNTYSMSTLQTIKLLGEKEIKMFEKVCGLLINTDHIPAKLFSPLDSVKDFMEKLGIDFANFQMLQSLGLFLPNKMSKVIDNPKRKGFELLYFDKRILFHPENDNVNEVELPYFYKLSLAGKQVFQHLKPQYVEAYYIWLRFNYKIPNYKLQDSGT